ncbi:MAG: hypothetical protein ABI193_21660 [Minicystis sp.]
MEHREAESRPASGEVRVIGGAARDAKVGELLAYQGPSGMLHTTWERVADDPAEPGMMMMREHGTDAATGPLFTASPEDLRRYVRVEVVS